MKSDTCSLEFSASLKSLFKKWFVKYLILDWKDISKIILRYFRIYLSDPVYMKYLSRINNIIIIRCFWYFCYLYFKWVNCNRSSFLLHCPALRPKHKAKVKYMLVHSGKLKDKHWHLRNPYKEMYYYFGFIFGCDESFL